MLSDIVLTTFTFFQQYGILALGQPIEEEKQFENVFKNGKKKPTHPSGFCQINHGKKTYIL